MTIYHIFMSKSELDVVLSDRNISLARWFGEVTAGMVFACACDWLRWVLWIWQHWQKTLWQVLCESVSSQGANYTELTHQGAPQQGSQCLQHLVWESSTFLWSHTFHFNSHAYTWLRVVKLFKQHEMLLVLVAILPRQRDRLIKQLTLVIS